MYFKRRKHQPSHVNVKPLAPAELEKILYGKPLTDTRDTPPLSAGAREARHILAAVNKEKQMPDMKTALSKVINQWEQETDMQSTTPTTTSNKGGAPATVGVSQATYQYVKDHPNVTKYDAIKALDAKGYKPTSTTTLLASMIRSGQIVLDSHGGMRVTLDHYTPIKTQAKAKPKAKPADTPVRDQAQGIAALQILPTQAPVPETRGNKLTAKQVLETLNVQEAYELYKELDKMFN